MSIVRGQFPQDDWKIIDDPEDDTRSAGWAAVPNWIIDSEDYTGHEKWLMVVLSRFHGTRGVWPAHATLARLAGVSVPTVKRTLNSLREKRAIDWQAQSKPGGGQTSNLYSLHFLSRSGRSE